MQVLGDRNLLGLIVKEILAFRAGAKNGDSVPIATVAALSRVCLRLRILLKVRVFVNRIVTLEHRKKGEPGSEMRRGSVSRCVRSTTRRISADRFQKFATWIHSHAHVLRVQFHNGILEQ